MTHAELACAWKGLCARGDKDPMVNVTTSDGFTYRGNFRCHDSLPIVLDGNGPHHLSCEHICCIELAV